MKKILISLPSSFLPAFVSFLLKLVSTLCNYAAVVVLSMTQCILSKFLLQQYQFPSHFSQFGVLHAKMCLRRVTSLPRRKQSKDRTIIRRFWKGLGVFVSYLSFCLLMVTQARTFNFISISTFSTFVPTQNTQHCVHLVFSPKFIPLPSSWHPSTEPSNRDLQQSLSPSSLMF